MGRTDAVNGTAAPGFQSLLRLLGDGGCWVKVSGAHRVSQQPPDYPDARPFLRSAGALPTPSASSGAADWPHPRMDNVMPDAGHLFELFMTGCRTRRPAGASSSTIRRGSTISRV